MKPTIHGLKKTWPFQIYLVLMVLLLPIFQRWQEPFNAWMMRLNREKTLTSPVRIVYFDSRDIEALGGWPLSRNVYGFLIHRLKQLGVKQTGIHVYWGDNGFQDENDLFLLSALDSASNVVGSYYFQQMGISSGLEKTIPFLAWPGRSIRPAMRASDLQPPDSLFFTSNTRFGFVNLPLTSSGTVTEAPLMIACGRAVYPSFNLMLARGFANDISVPRSGKIRINYQVNTRQLPMIPVRDIINPDNDRQLRTRLEGAIVIIGIISPQLGFERPTPLDPSMPVIGIHAQAVDNLLNGSWLRDLPVWLALIPLIIIGLAAFLFPGMQSRQRWFVYGGLLVLFPAITGFLWQQHIIFPLTACLCGLFACAVRTGLQETRFQKRQYQEEKEKRLVLESRFSEKVQSVSQLEREYLQLREKYRNEIDGLRSALAEIPEGGKSEIMRQFPEIICSSGSPMVKLLSEIDRIGQTDESVFISGESGTGKELMARAIHEHSPRAGSPFIAVNCGAVTESLLESELFGHEKGAFTGASQARTGFFEAAADGTIFLDEITETTPAFQAKLLRVLQEGAYFRVGSTRVYKAQCRVIAATNQDVLQQVNNGRFRQDLYFRLNVLPVRVPPLRERPADIPILLQRFLKDKPVIFSTGANEMLEKHVWPGNVRELQNLAARIRLLPDDVRIVSDWLKTQLNIESGSHEVSDPLDESILALYRDYQFSNDANTRIAEAIGGLHRSTVTEYLKGMMFLYFHDSGYDTETTIRQFNEKPDAKCDDRLRRRLMTYLTNLNDKIDLHKDYPSNILNLQDQLRKLPNKYHEALRGVVRAKLDGKW